VGVPTIVFHGDADATVTPGNGNAIAAEAAAAFEGVGTPLRPSSRIEPSPQGRSCQVTAYTDRAGRSLVEEWVVRGGAHAWFGGSPTGSYTDATGPDASEEIVRFFLQR
jgi:poly(3-hydroxybutyrate) depolymerase